MTSKGEEFELYKLTIEMADRLSARRGAANTFFISLDSALSAALGVWIGNGETISLRRALALGSVSVMISVLWWIQVTSYRNISTAKFTVIHEIEEKLSFDPYTKEWALLKAKGKWHFDLTNSERITPFVFLAIHLILIWTATR